MILASYRYRFGWFSGHVGTYIGDILWVYALSPILLRELCISKPAAAQIFSNRRQIVVKSQIGAVLGSRAQNPRIITQNQSLKPLWRNAKTTISRCNAKTQSRQSSAASVGRPYATTENINASRTSIRPNSNITKSKSEQILNVNRKARSAPNQNNSKLPAKQLHGEKTKRTPRQWSADSGVGTDCSNSVRTHSDCCSNIFPCDEPFILPARITAYVE